MPDPLRLRKPSEVLLRKSATHAFKLLEAWGLHVVSLPDITTHPPPNAISHCGTTGRRQNFNNSNGDGIMELNGTYLSRMNGSSCSAVDFIRGARRFVCCTKKCLFSFLQPATFCARPMPTPSPGPSNLPVTSKEGQSHNSTNLTEDVCPAKAGHHDLKGFERVY